MGVYGDSKLCEKHLVAGKCLSCENDQLRADLLDTQALCRQHEAHVNRIEADNTALRKVYEAAKGYDGLHLLNAAIFEYEERRK